MHTKHYNNDKSLNIHQLIITMIITTIILIRLTTVSASHPLLPIEPLLSPSRYSREAGANKKYIISPLIVN